MTVTVIVLYLLSVVFALVGAVVTAAGPVERPWARANWLALAFALFVFVFLLKALTGSG
jgi:hypothetical protein